MNRDFRNLVGKAFTMLPNLRVIYGSKLITSDLTVYSLKLYAPDDDEPFKWLTALYRLQQHTQRPILPFMQEVDVDNDNKLSRPETTKALDVSTHMLTLI